MWGWIPHNHHCSTFLVVFCVCVWCLCICVWCFCSCVWQTLNCTPQYRHHQSYTQLPAQLPSTPPLNSTTINIHHSQDNYPQHHPSTPPFTSIPLMHRLLIEALFTKLPPAARVPAYKALGRLATRMQLGGGVASPAAAMMRIAGAADPQV